MYLRFYEQQYSMGRSSRCLCLLQHGMVCDRLAHATCPGNMICTFARVHRRKRPDLIRTNSKGWNGLLSCMLHASCKENIDLMQPQSQALFCALASMTA